jgi:hypothetical protein
MAIIKSLKHSPGLLVSVFDLTLAEVMYHDERGKGMTATTQKMYKILLKSFITFASITGLVRFCCDVLDMISLP